MTRKIDPQLSKTPARLAHVVLRVPDLKRSVAWYGEVLGMEVVQAVGPVAFLTFDHEHHRLALIETPIAPPREEGAAGLDHVAFAVDSLGHLLATYVRLKALGHAPALPINHGPTTSLYYRDPDGNGVEFFVDNFETEAELKGWMQSDAFRANPLGVTFDPDDLVSRYESGEAIEDLSRIPSGGS